MGEPARRRPVRARPPTAHGTGSGRGTQRLAGNLQHRERTSPGNPPGPEIERARGLHARARLPEPRHRRRQLQRRRRQHAPATHRRIGHRASRSHRPAWSQTIIRQAPSTPHSAQETAESQKNSQKAPDEQDIQPASQRQRHGGRGRAHRRLPIAFRTRARDPRTPTCGHAQMLPMRRTPARL